MDSASMDRFVLDRHIVSAMVTCKDEFLREGKRDIYFHESANLLVARLSAFVWSESVKKEYRSVRYPENCWQHLKERFFLPYGWVRTKWPVKMRKEPITFEVKAVYPDFRPSLGKHQVRFTGIVNQPLRVGQ